MTGVVRRGIGRVVRKLRPDCPECGYTWSAHRPHCAGGCGDKCACRHLPGGAR